MPGPVNRVARSRRLFFSPMACEMPVASPRKGSVTMRIHLPNSDGDGECPQPRAKVAVRCCGEGARARPENDSFRAVRTDTRVACDGQKTRDEGVAGYSETRDIG